MTSEATNDAAGHSDGTRALVARLRAGDPEAGALLNSLYRDALVRFCWGYLGQIDAAEDAVQDISFKVLTTKGIPDAFRPWIYKIARNHCLNLVRRRRRRRDGAPLPSASQLQDYLTGHLTGLVRKEQHTRLAELVMKLPEAHREVLRLRYVEDLSRAEIADVLDLAESVVKSRLFEGLKELREQVATSDGS